MKKISLLLLFTFLLTMFSGMISVMAFNDTKVTLIPDIIKDVDGQRSESYVRLKDFERDMNSIAYIEGNDIFIRAYDFPVKYIDNDGVIKDKSNKISKNSIFSKYKYSVENNDVKQYFPKNIGDGILLTCEYGSLKMKPNVSGSFNARKMDNDNIVEYPDVFGSSTILTYKPEIDCLKEDIILNNYSGRNTFSFAINTTGLILALVDDKISVLNSNGDVLYFIKDIISYDQTGKYSIGSIDFVRMDDFSYIINIIVSEEFLTSADTIYPVRIDPTFAFSPVSSSIKQISKPFSTAVVTESITNPINVFRDNNGGISVAYVRIPEISNYMMIYNLNIASITSLKLYLYQESSNISGTNAKLGLHPLTVSANASPESKLNSFIDTSLTVTTKSSKDNTYIDFELLSLLSIDNCDIGTNGFIIRTRDASINSSVSFNSMTAIEHKPYIVFRVSNECQLFNSFLPNSTGLSETYYIKNANSNFYLSESVNDMTSSYGDNNKFMLIPTYSDSIHRFAYTIRSSYTGKYYCLSADGNTILLTDAPTYFTNNYLWDISSDSSLRYIINLSAPNRFLSYNSNSVIISEINASYTKWRIIVADFYCTIKNASIAETNKYITVHKGLSYLTDSNDNKIPKVNVYQNDLATDYNNQEYLNGQVFRVEQFSDTVEGTTKTVYRIHPLSSMLGKGCVLNCTSTSGNGYVKQNAMIREINNNGSTDFQQYFQLSSGANGFYIKTAFHWDDEILYVTAYGNGNGSNTGIYNYSIGNIFFSEITSQSGYYQLWVFEEDNTFLNQVVYYTMMNFGSPINGVSLTSNINISDDYGPRQLCGVFGFHSGLDFNYSQGTTLKAPISATVVDANYIRYDYNGEETSIFKKRGYYITLEVNQTKYGTNQKIYIIYFHMKQPTQLSIGQTVSTGQSVGYIGATGPVTGPHLHYSITINQNSTNQSYTINPQFFYYYSNMILQ